VSAPNARHRGRLRNGSETPRKRATPSGTSHGALGVPRDPQNVTAAQLLTAQQLAERWQIPRGQVYRLSREKRIPVVRLGKYVRYRIDAIERWEEEQTNA
jgi:excisionase family DNA binding protein